MQLTIKGKNVEVTDALKEFAEKRLGKMERFFGRIISTDVIFSTERQWHIVEVTVYANGFVVRGEERTEDMYSSIDRVLEKLEKQLKRHKGKFIRKHAGDSIRTEPDALIDALPEEHPRPVAERQDEMEASEPKVTRVRHQPVKPMSIAEAVKELEALGFAFLVFTNAETDAMSVLYKRKNGYALIEP